MKISQEKFERLLRFLDAEMDPAEITAFEQEIKDDPDLKEQLDLQLSLSGLFSENKPGGSIASETDPVNDAGTLRSILKEAKNKFLADDDSSLAPVINISSSGKNNSHVVGPNASRWLAAASVIGLALVSSLVYYSGKKNNNIDLVVNNDDTAKKGRQQVIITNKIDTIQKRDDRSPKKMEYASLANESYTKDKGLANPPQLLTQEISDYDAGNYTTIQAFDANNIPKTRGTVDELSIKAMAHYYKGLSFIETKNNEAARSNLQWVIDSSADKLLQIKATWYQAIVYLRTADIQKAELLLNRVASNKTEGIYKQRAEVLIKKINEGK